MLSGDGDDNDDDGVARMPMGETDSISADSIDSTQFDSKRFTGWKIEYDEEIEVKGGNESRELLVTCEYLSILLMPMSMC